MLIGVTAVAFFVVDAVAAKIASGSWQLLPAISGDDRGTYLAIQLTLSPAALLTVRGVRRPVDGCPAGLPPIGFVIRIRAEEPELRRTFGAAYDAYADGKARLVPGIW